MKTYELIDRTDNDCHDNGTREEMQREADYRNERESTSRWIVKPAGYSDRHYRG